MFIGCVPYGFAEGIRNIDSSYAASHIAYGCYAARRIWEHTYRARDYIDIDADGNLFIVGRKKEMILGPSGENVYPDELEDLYGDSPYVKELSVVGLSEGSGEQIACAVVASPDHDPKLNRAEVIFYSGLHLESNATSDGKSVSVREPTRYAVQIWMVSRPSTLPTAMAVAMSCWWRWPTA